MYQSLLIEDSFCHWYRMTILCRPYWVCSWGALAIVGNSFLWLLNLWYILHTCCTLWPYGANTPLLVSHKMTSRVRSLHKQHGCNHSNCILGWSDFFLWERKKEGEEGNSAERCARNRSCASHERTHKEDCECMCYITPGGGWLGNHEGRHRESGVFLSLSLSFSLRLWVDSPTCDLCSLERHWNNHPLSTIA